MSEKKYDITLSEEQLLFLSELIILSRLGQEFQIIETPISFFVKAHMNHELEKLAQDALLGSLSCSSFRCLFSQHLETHPFEEIRTDGSEWLSEILVRDVD